LARETKKFRYAEIKKGGRAAEFEGALSWLSQAGLVHLSTNIKTPLLPLGAYQDESKFKLYLVDTGILAALLGVSAKTIVEGHKLFAQYNGAFTENFVAQELTAAGHGLHYWTSESQAEVDFVIHEGEEIFPLEVKAGLSRQKKSLLVYGEKYQPNFLCRATLRNFKQDGKITNYPLYAVALWPQGLSGSG
jgi:predicted AAA+ superfamily ATPase